MNIKAYLKNPFRVFYHFNYTKISHLLSDEALIKLVFRARLGYKLDLNNPKTFNEKIQWLKLYNRKPEYTAMVDKFEVKRIIANTIGEQYIISTIGVWDDFDSIDFESLPEQFVLKCTHDSGSTIVCKNKRYFDKEKARQRINNALQESFYLRGREWAYKNVHPRIIAEEYIEDKHSDDLPDYKFFCFSGKPEYIMFCQNRHTKKDLTFDFYDKDWNHMNFVRPPFHGNSNTHSERPASFETMLRLATQLSQGIPLVRVDFYSVNGRIYFGEYTFYPGDGFEPFEPEIWDRKLGDLIVLPEKKI